MKTFTNVFAWSIASASKLRVAITPIPGGFAARTRNPGSAPPRSRRRYPRSLVPQQPGRPARSCGRSSKLLVANQAADGRGRFAPLRLIKEATAFEHPGPLLGGYLDVPR